MDVSYNYLKKDWVHSSYQAIEATTEIVAPGSTINMNAQETKQKAGLTSRPEFPIDD